MGFINKETIQAQLERSREALDNVEMTIVQQQAFIGDDGELLIQTLAVVRDEAFDHVIGVADAKKEQAELDQAFNNVVAHEAEDNLEATAARLAAAISDPEKLERMVNGESIEDECAHERQHEGLCLDCQKEVVTDE